MLIAFSILLETFFDVQSVISRELHPVNVFRGTLYVVRYVVIEKPGYFLFRNFNGPEPWIIQMPEVIRLV